jgi:hypothetical protein
MKISSIILITSLIAAPAVMAQSAPATAPAPTMHRERHPEMMRALRELRAARRDLAHAAHDFNGQRVAALNHTNAAITEVEAGLKSDQH